MTPKNKARMEAMKTPENARTRLPRKEETITIVGYPGPTARGIEQLFKELRSCLYDLDERKYHRALRKQLDDMQEAWNKTAKVVAIRKKIDDARDVADEKRRGFESRIDALRLRYLAEGLTQDVAKEVQQLLALIYTELD